MNVKDRLREAFESVAFNADSTWLDSNNIYQKTNLELYSAEKRLEQFDVSPSRPRTVRDCIPSSRLATYVNSKYCESREMCYVPCTSTPSHVPFNFLPKEPWEMFEVDELFYWYMANILPLTVPVQDNVKMKFKEMLENRLNSNYHIQDYYQPSFFKTIGFEDTVLKIQLTEDRIKNIWSCNKSNDNGISKLFINIYFSPLKNYYVLKNDVQFDYNWYWKVSSSKDQVQIEKLLNELQALSDKTEKCLREAIINENSNATTPANIEPSSNEVLYSEVLQGIASSRKASKHEQNKPLVPEETSSSSKTEVEENNFTNFTVLNRQKPCLGQKTEPTPIRLFPNKSKFSAQEKPPVAKPTPFYPNEILCGRNIPRHDAQPFSDPNKGVALPQQPNYAYPQTYFYQPVQPNQRWIPCYTTQMYNTGGGWFGHNPVIVPPFNYDMNRQCDMFAKRPHNSFSCHSSASNSIQAGGGGGVVRDISSPDIDEFPFSTSTSEELEIQALEQYNNNSNENFYKELERQAAEQYAPE